MKAFGDLTPLFGVNEKVAQSKAISSCETIGAVPGSNPQNVHFIYMTKTYLTTFVNVADLRGEKVNFRDASRKGRETNFSY